MNVLRKNWQFREVYQRGERVVCKPFLLFFLRGEQTDTACFGFVASKRVGNAVKRNRAKRVMREACRRVADKLIHQNLWIVIVARPALLTASYQEVLIDLEKSLRLHLHAICNYLYISFQIFLEPVLRQPAFVQPLSDSGET